MNRRSSMSFFGTGADFDIIDQAVGYIAQVNGIESIRAKFLYTPNGIKSVLTENHEKTMEIISKADGDVIFDGVVFYSPEIDLIISFNPFSGHEFISTVGGGNQSYDLSTIGSYHSVLNAMDSAALLIEKKGDLIYFISGKSILVVKNISGINIAVYGENPSWLLNKAVYARFPDLKTYSLDEYESSNFSVDEEIRLNISSYDKEVNKNYSLSQLLKKDIADVIKVSATRTKEKFSEIYSTKNSSNNIFDGLMLWDFENMLLISVNPEINSDLFKVIRGGSLDYTYAEIAQYMKIIDYLSKSHVLITKETELEWANEDLFSILGDKEVYLLNRRDFMTKNQSGISKLLNFIQMSLSGKFTI